MPPQALPAHVHKDTLLVSMGQGHPPRVNGTSFSSCLPTAKPTLTEMNIVNTQVALSPQGTLGEWTWEGEQT